MSTIRVAGVWDKPTIDGRPVDCGAARGTGFAVSTTETGHFDVEVVRAFPLWEHDAHEGIQLDVEGEGGKTGAYLPLRVAKALLRELVLSIDYVERTEAGEDVRSQVFEYRDRVRGE